MEGTYPILMHGEKTGELVVRHTGLLIEFEGNCTDPGELVRLSVYGDKEGYLGVMMPEDGKLHIKKKLSKHALRDFPVEITHAAPAGMELETPEKDAKNEKTVEAETPKEAPPKEKEQEEKEQEEKAQVKKQEPEKTPEVQEEPQKIKQLDEVKIMEEETCEENKSISSAPQTQKKPAKAHIHLEIEGDILWRPYPMPWSLVSGAALKSAMSDVKGALAASQDGMTLLAIPESLDLPLCKEISNKDVRDIEGTTYHIIKIKDGKILESFQG